jgi:uncharacterized protein YbjQ (UPF0145 family)
MFIYRAVLDAISELLTGESKKAEQSAMAKAEQDALREAAEAAEKVCWNVLLYLFILWSLLCL